MERLLELPGGRVSVGLQQQLDAGDAFRRGDGEPPVLARGMSFFTTNPSTSV